MRWWMMLGVLVLACDGDDDSEQPAGGGGTGAQGGTGGSSGAGHGGEAADGGSAGRGLGVPLMAPSDGSTCSDSLVRCSYEPVTRCLCVTLDMDSACVELDPRCDMPPGEGGSAGGPSFERVYQCDCVEQPPAWACTQLE